MGCFGRESGGGGEGGSNPSVPSSRFSVGERGGGPFQSFHVRLRVVYSSVHPEQRRAWKVTVALLPQVKGPGRFGRRPGDVARSFRCAAPMRPMVFSALKKPVAGVEATSNRGVLRRVESQVPANANAMT